MGTKTAFRNAGPFAPLGREPFHWQRLSGLGARRTPDGRQLRWLLVLQAGSGRSAQVVRFWNALRRQRRRPVILLLVGLPAHRSAPAQRAVRQHRDWRRVERSPAYAPALNPVESLWDDLDDTVLANPPVENVCRLRRWVRHERQQARRRRAVARGFQVGARQLL